LTTDLSECEEKNSPVIAMSLMKKLGVSVNLHRVENRIIILITRGDREDIRRRIKLEKASRNCRNFRIKAKKKLAVAHG
jgi:hypothetical protein